MKKRFINIILLTMLVVILSGCGGAEQTSDKEPEIPKTNQNDIELSIPPILQDSKGEVLKSEKDALEDVQNFINKQNTTKQGEVGLSIVEFVELV
ncbi:LptM family lipoprotein, partial [Listeria innocua]|uniref:LptM family lipoprotein n=2 Tax=Listeria TaxID=1637 RepID=UPI0035D66BD1